MINSSTITGNKASNWQGMWESLQPSLLPLRILSPHAQVGIA
jgi:hypothetical protein